MDQVSRALLMAAGKTLTAKQKQYTEPGTYSWVAPAGVTSVCVVAVGPGAVGDTYSSGGGGGLGYKNNIAVTPGNSYTVKVGQAGSTNSSFINEATVCGNAAPAVTPGGSFTGDGGGSGGTGLTGGTGYRSGNGAGAGRYGTSGPNGTVADANLVDGLSGGSPGVGVNLDGTVASTGTGYGFGGGASGDDGNPQPTTPGGGAVRIIWGAGRSFPSTNLADQFE